LTEYDALSSEDMKVTTNGNVTVSQSGGGTVFEGWTNVKQMKVSKFLRGKYQDG